MLRSSLARDGRPEYPGRTDRVVRALDPTEHNMERLNRMARGAGTTYTLMRVRGRLEPAQVRRALGVMTRRHPMLRVRIDRNPRTGRLVFAPTRGADGVSPASVPFVVHEVEDLDRWPELVEWDMNLGCLASGRGPLFALALLQPKADGAQAGESILVELHHHAVADGRGGVVLLRELLEELTSPRDWPVLVDRPVESNFADPPLHERELTELAARAGAVLASPRDEDSQTERGRIIDELEGLEAELLAAASQPGRYSITLPRVHALLAELAAATPDRVPLRSDVDVGGEAHRFERVRSRLLARRFGGAAFTGLVSETKRRGVSVQAVLVTSALFGQARRHWKTAARRPTTFSVISPVDLRRQFVPPLEPCDIRMPVDVALTHATLHPGAQFWEVADRVGRELRKSVDHRRALSSWFSTPARDLNTAPSGTPLVIVSNMGRLEVQERYGGLEVLEVFSAITGHGGPYLGTLLSSFRDQLCLTFQFEEPTISEPTAGEFADDLLERLRRIAEGQRNR